MTVESSGPTLALSDDRLPVGELFVGRYAVLGMLGEGGMGAVYRVLDRELDEEVALKVLRAEIAKSGDAVERFRREVKLARKVTHPNVARTYDLGTSGEHRYLTMELIEGASLARRAGAGRMALADALRIAADVCRGLCAAHAVGVVHRDLKPDNIMLAGDRGEGPLGAEVRVVITDFGIARLSETRAPAQTNAGVTSSGPVSTGAQPRSLTVGMVIGTPAYMAPEQVLGQDLDGRADIYALGVLMFELLAGRLPFAGDSGYAMAAARLHTTAPDLRELEGSVPDAVASLVAEALATKRDDRPDAQRMLQALDALRGAGRAEYDSLGRSTSINPASAFESAPSASRPRSVAVLPLSAFDAPDRALAGELSSTLADALSKLRALRVVPPTVSASELAAHLRPADDSLGFGPSLDHGAVARALKVDRVLTGAVRSEGPRVRVNLRVLDPNSGAQPWAERFDGTRDELFALEDALTRGAVDALRSMVAATDENASAAGPSDPAVRALYDRARVAYNKFLDPASIGECVELLRKAHAMAPDDASVLSALGASLMRLALMRRDDSLVVREAEDFALRALAADPSLGETYATMGLVRLHQGQLRNALRAFREAVARNPRHAEASSYLGRMLAECGQPRDGIRRLELAVRLDPSMQRAYWDLARTYALEGDRERCLDALARSDALGANVSGIPLRCRLGFWWGDVDFLRETLAISEQSAAPLDSFPRVIYEPLLRAVVSGRPLTLEDDTWITQAPKVVSLTNRAFVYQMSTELRCTMGDRDGALTSLERAGELPLIDLLWLDKCPLLAFLRDSPRYGRVRAAVAGRVAELLS